MCHVGKDDNNLTERTMQPYNAKMRPLDNVDAQGWGSVRKTGSMLVYEIYDDGRLIFEGTPSQITTWMMERQEESTIETRKPR